MINEGSPIIQQQNQYYYSPATRFQSNFANPMAGQAIHPQSSPQGQFGTLGYNPNMGYGSGYVPQYGNYGATMNQSFGPINQYVDKTVSIPGYNPSNNETLMTDDIEKKMDDLAKKMCKEQETQFSRQKEIMSTNPYNYYGYINQGYLNPYTLSTYKKQQDALYQEAVDNRRNFNKKLSTAARKYLGMEVDNEEINTIYNERTMTIPASSIQESYNMQKLSEYTVDVGESTKAQCCMANNAITEKHNEIIKPDSDLNTFLNNAGSMLYEIEFEKLQASKRDKTSMYQNNGSFNRYIDEQVSRRDGTMISSMFPNLTRNGSILEDGTLSIKCPDWAKKNEAEVEYEQARQKFIQSIYQN